MSQPIVQQIVYAVIHSPDQEVVVAVAAGGPSLDLTIVILISGKLHQYDEVA